MSKSTGTGRQGGDNDAIAALGFEACDEKALGSLPSNETWINPHLVTVRVAGALICKSKVELQHLWREDPGLQFDTLQQLAETQEALKCALKILQSAEARLIVAGEAASRQ